MFRYFLFLFLFISLNISCFSQDYYTQGMVYEQIYRLSLDLQAKLYKNFYLDRQLEEKFPSILYFYGRILQETGQNDLAKQYFEKYQKAKDDSLTPILATIEIWKCSSNQSELETLLKDIKKLQDIQILSGIIVTLKNTDDFKQITEIYQRLLELKNSKPGWESNLYQAAITLSRFYSNPNDNNAKEVLKINIPQIRYERNFFYDPVYYRHFAYISFYLGASQKNLSGLMCNLKIKHYEQAKEIYNKIKTTLPNWQQSCIEGILNNAEVEEKWMDWVTEYQSKFVQPIEQIAMLETLIAAKQTALAAQCFTPEITTNSDFEQKVWEIQFEIGDSELRDKLREVVDNWWSKFGVEEESSLQMIRLSRFLLGDNFITPHIRRLLSTNNPFHDQSKLMKEYSQTKLIKSTMLLYVAGGRQ